MACDEDRLAGFAALMAEMEEIRRHVGALEYATVQFMKQSGASWEDIGYALDMSRQAATRKYAKPRRRLL